MPVHDWTRVAAGIFHDFHLSWIGEIKRVLNLMLPPDYYALAEQRAAGFEPDVLTLQSSNGTPPQSSGVSPPSNGGVGLLQAPPKLKVTAETDWDFYRRKQNVVAVRHVSGDRIVAVVEIVSPGNKSTRGALRSFVEKAGDLLLQDVHLLVIDLLPPGPRDPQGIHSAIWEEIAGVELDEPPDKPLTLATYETAAGHVRAYVIPFAVGDSLTDMPLFLEPGGHIVVPLEATYQTAWAAVPRRWRTVLEP